MVGPTLGLPTELHVDGRPMRGRLEHLGPTPTLTWTASVGPHLKHVLTLREGGTGRRFLYELDIPELVLAPDWPSPAQVDVSTVREAPGLAVERAVASFGEIAR